MRKFVVSLFIIFGIFVVVSPVLAAGLVPCEGPDCQACHIVQLGQKTITWFISLAAGITALVFAIGGLKMVMAGGDTGSVSSARQMMTNAVVGFVILLASFLIIDTALKLFTGNKLGPWNTIQCVAQPERTTTQTTAPVTTTPGTAAAGKMTDADARALLAGSGVTVNKTEAQGTSLEGINQATVADAIQLHNNCNCNIVITGGTEGGVHSNGTMSHGNGYKYDVRPNSTLDTYITTNYTNAGTRSDGAALYRAPNGSLYAREGDHWDVQVPQSS